MYKIMNNNVYTVYQTATSISESFYGHVATPELKALEGAIVETVDVSGQPIETVRF